MDVKKCLSLQSREGCKRWLAILMAVVLLSSFFAALISSNAGKIKIEGVTFDARGAELSGDLYYPAGVTDEESYPAVILAPGAGVVKENMRGVAEELAKRGYVVLNVNPYGNGLSETPVYNENDMGPDQFNIFATPLGVLDAVDFLRGMHFVDSTRIGLSGHSQGSRRTGYAALMDCGYYTFNDVLLILLNEDFGVTITAEDILKDAGDVAAAALTPEALAIFNIQKERYRADYDRMVKSICLIGSQAQFCNPKATVQVAGIDVVRTCKMNQCVINGKYDFGYLSFNNAPATKDAWYIDPAVDIVNEGYYALDDLTNTSKLVGMFRKDTIKSNEELRLAIENRSLRIVLQTRETHSKNFFSNQTTAMVVDYFNQTLDTNADKLATKPSEIKFMWRELFNLIAMFGMVSLLIPLLSLYLLDKRYAPIAANVALKEDTRKTPVWARWAVFGLTIAFGFIAIYWTNGGPKIFNFKASLGYPLMITAWTTVHLLSWLAVAAAAVTVLFVAGTQKFLGFWEFIKSNFRIGITRILRCVVMAGAFIAVAYILLSAVEYLFQQDFRWWMTAYTELKANHWLYVFNYAVLMIPFFFVISCGINYLSNETLNPNKPVLDTVLTVVVNSAGLWLCCAVAAFLAYTGIKDKALFSSFILTYGAMVTVPINVFVLRKSYQITKNVWTGVVICAILTAWLLVSTSGMNGSYIPQSWLSIFLGR